MGVPLKIQNAIRNFPKKNKTTSLLIQVAPEESVRTQLFLTKNLTNRGFKVMALSGGRPCRDLLGIYKEKDINLKNIHIIDLICKSQKLKVKDSKNVTHMESIHSLTEISIYLNRMPVPNKTVLFIDSITSMLIYTDEAVFSRFVSNVVQKMKTRGIHLILLLIKTGNYNNLRAELKYLCDQEVGT